MYTSASKKVYLGMTVFCIIFSAVYEYFSHGVISSYMVSIFLFPLFIGVIPIAVSRKLKLPEAGKNVRTLHLWTVITLALASCMTGVFEIYGSVSEYVGIYWLAGAALLIATVIGYIKSIWNVENE